MEWTCQFEHSSKSTIGPRLGRKIFGGSIRSGEVDHRGAKGGRDPKTRDHERPLIGYVTAGLLNILFHELLDSLRCLKATGVGLIMGHR
jgi:hypothetical protein